MLTKPKNLAILIVLAISLSIASALVMDKAAAYMEPINIPGEDNVGPPIYSEYNDTQLIYGNGAKLRINGETDSSELQLNGSSNHWALYTHKDTSDFNIWYDDNLLTIDHNNGNVGIAEENPSEKLTVKGNILASGEIISPSLDVGSIKVDTLTASNTMTAQDLVVGGDLTVSGDAILQGGLGVYGTSQLSGNVGIGTAPTSDALTVNGTITATVKNFRINHPTKPGYVLTHSTIEGPEIAVFYRGEGKLKNGEAVIKLPDYFEALTRKHGRTVQLSPKGEEIFLLSAGEVKNGEFTAYGTKPSGEFSWEVKAIRADVEELEAEQKK